MKSREGKGVDEDYGSYSETVTNGVHGIPWPLMCTTINKRALLLNDDWCDVPLLLTYF